MAKSVFCVFNTAPPQCTLGWSDFHFFAIFETGTLLSIGNIFMSSIPKNRWILQRRAAKCSFSKNHGPWKLIFFFKLPWTFLLRQRPIAKNIIQIKGCLEFFFIFQKWRKRYLIQKIEKKYFFEFLFFLTLKNKEQIFFSGETFQNVK